MHKCTHAPKIPLVVHTDKYIDYSYSTIITLRKQCNLLEIRNAKGRSAARMLFARVSELKNSPSTPPHRFE